MPTFELLPLVFAVFMAVYLVDPDVVVRYKGTFIVGSLLWIGLSAFLHSPHIYFSVAALITVSLRGEKILFLNTRCIMWALRHHVLLLAILAAWGTSWALDPAGFRLWGGLTLIVLIFALWLLDGMKVK